MARTAKLKVFRMPVGFHDAYVAAPSQKAAVEAWGSDKDVFARGAAEQVTDPVLMAEPLASPGAVIKRSRGTPAEQIAALGDHEEPAKGENGSSRLRGGKKASEPAPKPQPRPSRSALEQAEKELTAAKAAQVNELQEISQREAALAKERKTLEKKQVAALERLVSRVEKARTAYEEVVRRWQDPRGFRRP